MGENGFVRITGRFKELIITAGGENVAPVPIEDSIKALCLAVSFAVMIGDKRKYNTVL
jgi:long-chain-fatty-acid--CoA ligase ACSBG